MFREDVDEKFNSNGSEAKKLWMRTSIKARRKSSSTIGGSITNDATFRTGQENSLGDRKVPAFAHKPQITPIKQL